jgi:GMP synthase-like glutamine amidotransferase
VDVLDVLVVANRDDPESGFVGDALLARGARLTEGWRDDLLAPEGPPALPGTPDLVLVLGSDWHVYDPEVAVAVDREATYLRDAVAAGIPVLGICYGAQVLAHALGGTVERDAGGGELGWYVVESDDPALPEGPYVQWHTDVFSLPPDAVELARSPVGSQAFSFGSAFAVQFHPEVTPEVLGRWAAGGRATLERLGLNAGGLVAEAVRRAPASRGHAEALVEAFLAGEFRQ